MVSAPQARHTNVLKLARAEQNPAPPSSADRGKLVSLMFIQAIAFPLAHWRGQIALMPTLVFSLLGLRLAIAWGGGVSFLLLDIAIYIWQVVGSWRALTRYQCDRPDFLVNVAGYGAMLATIPVLILPQLDRLARDNLAPMTLRDRGPNGVEVMPDHILLTGPVSYDMFDGFQGAISTNPDLKRVELNSNGGRVYAARAIAKLVQDNDLDTFVSGICASACTLVFIAGAHRTLAPEGKLGFHGYLTKSQIKFADETEEEAKDRATFLARGVSQDFVDQMFLVSPEDMWFPDQSQLEMAGVLSPP